MQETKIYLKQKKVSVTSILISIALFLYVTYKLILTNFLDGQQNSFFNEEYGKWLMLVVAVLYLWIIIQSVYHYFYRNKSKKVGILINEQGIQTFHSEASLLGIIRWEDILAVSASSAFTRDFVSIKVVNPEFYLDKIQHQFKKKRIFRNYYAKHHTPIIITTNHLEMKPPELRNLIKSKLKTYKKSP